MTTMWREGDSSSCEDDATLRPAPSSPYDDEVTLRFEGDEPTRLVDFLFRARRDFFISHAHCKRLVSRGRVSIGSAVARLDSLVTSGESVTLRPTHQILRSVDGLCRVVYFERLRVIMENDAWAVVVKPPGLLMYAAGTSRGGVDACVRTVASMLPFSLRPATAADALPVPVAAHRLDQPVGGLVAVAKTRAASRRLSALFASRRVVKTYVALLAGTPSSSAGDVASPVAPSRRPRRVTAV